MDSSADPRNEPEVNIKQEVEVDREKSAFSFVPLIKTEIVEIQKKELLDNFYQCDVCENTFETGDELTNHKSKKSECGDEKCDIKNELRDEIENIYICSVCSIIYETKEELVNHKKEHVKCHEHIKCNKCEVESEEDFTCTWELKVHLKTAHGMEDQGLVEETDVPYQCKFCTRRFVRLRNYSRHEKSHIAMKDFKCQFCPKNDSKNFRAHYLLKSHLYTHLKPFQCHFCLKCFSQFKYMRAHEKSHVGMKDLFQCQYCPSSYNSQESLIIHTRNHTGSFQCKMCSRSFHSQYLRSTHEKMHIVSDSLENL